MRVNEFIFEEEPMAAPTVTPDDKPLTSSSGGSKPPIDKDEVDKILKRLKQMSKIEKWLRPLGWFNRIEDFFLISDYAGYIRGSLRVNTRNGQVIIPCNTDNYSVEVDPVIDLDMEKDRTVSMYYSDGVARTKVRFTRRITERLLNYISAGVAAFATRAAFIRFMSRLLLIIPGPTWPIRVLIGVLGWVTSAAAIYLATRMTNAWAKINEDTKIRWLSWPGKLISRAIGGASVATCSTKNFTQSVSPIFNEGMQPSQDVNNSLSKSDVDEISKWAFEVLEDFKDYLEQEGDTETLAKLENEYRKVGAPIS